MHQKSRNVYYSVSNITSQCLKRKSQRGTFHCQMKSKSTKGFMVDILESALNLFNFKEPVTSTILQNQTQMRLSFPLLCIWGTEEESECKVWVFFLIKLHQVRNKHLHEIIYVNKSRFFRRINKFLLG